jgi:hypothetical protein
VNLKDSIGRREESIFTVLITRWCDRRPWFIESFLGEKHEATDFLVELIEPTAGHAYLYVPVKATGNHYAGSGASRKLAVAVTAEDVEKLKQIRAPAYVVGIDIDRVCGYITAITEASSGGINGIPVRHSLNCRTLKVLWREVDDYWKARSVLARKSKFADRGIRDEPSTVVHNRAQGAGARDRLPDGPEQRGGDPASRSRRAGHALSDRVRRR